MRLRRTVAAGFTLVELMVTISIIMLLAGLLTPSVIAIKEVWERNQCETQLANIRMAIWDYASDPRMGRTIPPSSLTEANRFYTGAESLGYYLLGPNATGHSVERHGVTSTAGPFYTARPEEVRRSYLSSIGGNWMGISGVGSSSTGRVFVDTYSTTYAASQAERTRPILYFAAQPPTVAGANPYLLGDNESIVMNNRGGFDWAPDGYAGQFNAAMQHDQDAGTYVRGFVLMSAGPDRQYFTDDDIIVLTERE